jgi:hypothetical protein
MSTSKRALLYMDWPLASDYLQDIRQLLVRNRRDIEVETAGYLRPPQHDKYDIVICCDEKSAAPPAPLRICVFHGLASKGQAFSTARAADFLRGNTIYAVPGTYYANLLAKLGVPDERIWVIGLTKLDGMQRNILFAPTHNDQLSAIPVIKNRIYELPNVRVQLHMYLRKPELRMHQSLAAHYPLHDTDHSSAENLEWADTVIGDFGSIIVEAISLGKQSVQVVNPLWKTFYSDRKGLTDSEIAELPEVWFPNKYAIKAHSFDDLYDLFHIMELGDSAQRLYNEIASRIT